MVNKVFCTGCKEAGSQGCLVSQFSIPMLLSHIRLRLFPWVSLQKTMWNQETMVKKASEVNLMYTGMSARLMPSLSWRPLTLPCIGLWHILSQIWKLCFLSPISCQFVGMLEPLGEMFLPTLNIKSQIKRGNFLYHLILLLATSPPSKFFSQSSQCVFFFKVDKTWENKPLTYVNHTWLWLNWEPQWA